MTSSGVEFINANGARLPVQRLSDGYRLVLSMTFELIRQMALSYEASELFSSNTQITAPGIVIVDEINAHLHPSWQPTARESSEMASRAPPAGKRSSSASRS